jgi:predicted DCC family thiol-disulfide oxidoreductase YuxK
MTTATAQLSTATTNKTVILFDGVCNFCNASINFLIDHDPADRFRFAAQQSEVGQKLMAEHGITGLMLNTLLVLDRSQILTLSGGAMRIARYMPWPWKLLSAFWVVPWFMRDAVYKLIARHRYQIFGYAQACRMPTPAIRAKFL